MTNASIDARAIQRALRMHGQDIAVDGEIGPKTRSAIYAVVQGKVGAAAHWSAERLMIAFEQIMLADAGIYKGAIDGVAGPLTSAALAMWQNAGQDAVAAPADVSKSSLPPWITIARSYIGTHEGVGTKDNPAVLEMFSAAGHPEIKHDSVAWCAAFVGACLRKAGQTPSGTLWALDYAKWGQALLAPIVGAIATKKRDGGGHVFFVVDFDGASVWGLGGNQSDQVSIVRYPRSAIYSYAWPRGALKPADLHAGAFRGGAVAAGREA
ncbi:MULTISPECIES: TIGR02594 family protein [Methylosinus]|nr:MULTISPECIES: TIGR02594 family protein [Methylosinus]OBS51845.1 hypothetical protein A8B73_14420 [Methylosinus sp. 3S-1]